MTRTNVAVGTLTPEQVQQVLAAARKAPAVRQVRPWRFNCTTTTIEMLLDLPRDAWGADDDHREATVACGAALLNLRLAIRSFGGDPVVHLLPRIDRPALLAVVEIDGRRPTTADGLELSLAIELLAQANVFQTSPLPDPLIVELRYAARIEQAWIALLPAPALPALRELLDESGRLKLLDRSAQVAVVGTLRDDPTSRLRAGQAMQRVLLTAIRAEFSASLITMSPGSTKSREQIRRMIGGGLWPQALMQIGRVAA